MSSLYVMFIPFYVTNSISLPVAVVLGLYLISFCEPVVSELVDTFLEPNAFMMMLYPNYIILYILDRPPN